MAGDGVGLKFLGIENVEKWNDPDEGATICRCQGSIIT